MASQTTEPVWSCELPATKTPYADPRAGLIAVLATAYRNVLQKDATPETLAMAWAQVSLETGRTRHMYNWNVANITASKRYRGCVHRLELPASEPPWYRAYRSDVAGAEDYWRLLARSYPESLAAFGTGDAKLAAKRLKAEGPFYTAPEAGYGDALALLYREMMPAGGSGGGRVAMRGAGAAVVLFGLSHLASVLGRG